MPTTIRGGLAAHPLDDSERLPLRLSNWQDYAACAGAPHLTDLFFPVGTNQKPPADLIKVCRGQCRVRLHCERHALTAPELFGWWGGRSPQWLREERRRRRRAARLARQRSRRRRAGRDRRSRLDSTPDRHLSIRSSTPVAIAAKPWPDLTPIHLEELAS